MFKKNLRPLLLFTLLFFLHFSIQAQNYSLQGTLSDNQSEKNLAGVEVQIEGTNQQSLSNEAGIFRFENLEAGNIILVFLIDGGEVGRRDVDLQKDTDLGKIAISSSAQLSNEISVITLNENELANDEDDGSDVSGLLTASRDPFASAAAFQFGFARFRIRGYDSENTNLYMNGVPVNDLENGRLYWGAWGGLNDVMRRRETTVGLSSVDYGMAGIGGASQIDLRPSSQREQTRVSYAISNRSYRNRLMVTHSTGMQKNGWAYTLSGSRRWGQEGYVEGSFYDAWGYFASIEKRVNDQHSLNLTVMGAPTNRGKNGASTQEMYDLTDNNYYNPYWGYQNGEKRNSRVARSHQPMAILRHDWTIGKNTKLMTAINFQDGKNGSTALDWYNAPDPRPDYYRRLPSAIDSEETAARVAQVLANDENARQLNWHSFYEVNRNNFQVIRDVNGEDGNTAEGNRSNYIVEERRYDAQKINFNTNLQTVINDNFTLHGGLAYQSYKGDNYKVVDDLLGGDFYVDVDKFAERDLPGNNDAQQSDLNNPNRIVRQGATFGYHYGSNIKRASGWVQGVFSLSKFDINVGGEVSNSQFWRTGFYKNGKFPDNSFGDSEKQSFLNYNTKAGITYKINGRNYLYANGAYLTRAPYFRNSYVSPRTRDQLAPGLTDETIFSGEAGYNLRSPYVKGRIGVYYTEFKDQVTTRSFYHEEFRSFVNFTMSGVNKQHFGTEMAVQAKIVDGLTLNGAAAIGQYIYTSRPTAVISQDNNASLLNEGQTIYAKNFYVQNTPQTAGTIGLEYRGKRYWFATVNFNYFNNTWMDFNPVRRTEEAVNAPDPENNVDPSSQLWSDIINQEKADSGYTLDFFGGKSFKFGDYFIYLNVGVNNILNNRSLVTGGYEQLRFDVESKDVNRFPSKYYYGYGTTYYISVALRL